jgi:hypothetical protein
MGCRWGCSVAEYPLKETMGTRLNAKIKTEVSVILASYCAHRCPAKFKDKVRLGFRFRGNSVTLYEERPTFTRPSIWIDIVVAQFRYNPKSQLWTLYWANRNSRWFCYWDLDASKDFLDLLAEVEADPSGIFWG